VGIADDLRLLAGVEDHTLDQGLRNDDRVAAGVAVGILAELLTEVMLL
jgi:hypothetical protein